MWVEVVLTLFYVTLRHLRILNMNSDFQIFRKVGDRHLKQCIIHIYNSSVRGLPFQLWPCKCEESMCFLPIVSFPACSRPKLGQRSCNTDILVDFYMLQDWTYFVRKLQAAACSLTKSLGYFHYLKVNRKKDRCCFKIQFSIRKKKTSSICLIFIFSKILVIFFLNLIAW
jgi:hypothetical protein